MGRTDPAAARQVAASGFDKTCERGRPVPVFSSATKEIYYEIDGSGPPLLLGHGLTETRSIWQDLGYVDLLEDRFTVLRADARGHGQSFRPAGSRNYSLRGFVEDITDLLDHLGIAAVHYLGYSMGGRIGYACLLYAPERLRTALIGGSSPFDRPTAPVTVRTEADVPDFLAAMNGFAGSSPMDDPFAGRSLEEIRACADILLADWPDLTPGLAARSISVQLFCGSLDPRLESIQRTCAMFPGIGCETLYRLDHSNALSNSRGIVGLLERQVFGRLDTGEVESRSPEVKPI